MSVTSCAGGSTDCLLRSSGASGEPVADAITVSYGPVGLAVRLHAAPQPPPASFHSHSPPAVDMVVKVVVVSVAVVAGVHSSTALLQARPLLVAPGSGRLIDVRWNDGA